jgi:tetratricopeptide (TPR) repeat protein
VHLREAVRLDPQNADALDNLGRLERQLGDHAAAQRHFEQATAARPNWVAPLVDLAWMLSVNPAAAPADRQRAVALAEHAVDLTARHDVLALDALAGAWAATGNFDRAVAILDEAVRAAAGTPAAAILQQRQDRYRQRLAPLLP